MATKAIDSHITDSDNERYQQIFRDSLSSNDIQAIYYGAANAHESELKKATCTKAESVYKESKLNVIKNFNYDSLLVVN